MSLHYGATPSSLNAANEILGGRGSYVIANNTRLHVDGELAAIRLHDTDIVQLRPDGSCVLNSGGWLTATTRERMNRYLPAGWRIYTEKGIWYAEYGGYRRFSESAYQAAHPGASRRTVEKQVDSVAAGEFVAIPYADGLTIWPHGNYRLPAAYRKPAELAAQREAVAEYARGFVAALQAGEIELSHGDCFFCQGMAGSEDAGHIESHIAESYYVGSMLMTALKDRGASMGAQGWAHARMTNGNNQDSSPWHQALGGVFAAQVTKALTAYCRRRLGMAP